MVSTGNKNYLQRCHFTENINSVGNSVCKGGYIFFKYIRKLTGVLYTERRKSWEMKYTDMLV